ncbi:hypothetical protein CRG98_005212 [Punica granatum]|uniref:Uncharacterized protein n=1 Tax=Punica granatum TaxID=22663 RepID=A0A2I0L0U5_PUNGR|nr:hypothetical protein CRG98_005212 [Punica granatum]
MISKMEGLGVANWRPQTLHQGRRHPQRTPATSADGSRSPIGGPDPESTGDPKSESLVDSGSSTPIGDPDPSIEGTGVLCGCRRPRWRGRGLRLAAPTPSLSPRSIRGRGRQSANPTPLPRASASSVGADALGGGFKVAN